MAFAASEPRGYARGDAAVISVVTTGREALAAPWACPAGS